MLKLEQGSLISVVFASTTFRPRPRSGVRRKQAATTNLEPSENRWLTNIG